MYAHTTYTQQIRFNQKFEIYGKHTRHYYSATQWIQKILSNIHHPDVTIHTQHLVIQWVIRYPSRVRT